MVSVSINPLPSYRLHCCDRYIRCQRSLAVKPLNSYPRCISHCSCWACAMTANWCMRSANWLNETSLTVTAQGGLWTLTRMCSITQTDATKRDCGLSVLKYTLRLDTSLPPEVFAITFVKVWQVAIFGRNVNLQHIYCHPVVCYRRPM